MPIKFIPMNPMEPRIFGFPEFISGLAIMVLVWTLIDYRYKTRLSLQGEWASKFMPIGMAMLGIMTLTTDFMRASSFPLPESIYGFYVTPSMWQVFMGLAFMGMIGLWIHKSFYQKLSFNERTSRSFHSVISGAINSGNPEKIQTVCEEIVGCYGDIFKSAMQYNPENLFVHISDSKGIVEILTSSAFSKSCYTNRDILEEFAKEFWVAAAAHNRQTNSFIKNDDYDHHENEGMSSFMDNPVLSSIGKSCCLMLSNIIIDRHHPLNEQILFWGLDFGYSNSYVSNDALMGIFLSASHLASTTDFSRAGSREIKVMRRACQESIKTSIRTADGLKARKSFSIGQDQLISPMLCRGEDLKYSECYDKECIEYIHFLSEMLGGEHLRKYENILILEYVVRTYLSVYFSRNHFSAAKMDSIFIPREIGAEGRDQLHRCLLNILTQGITVLSQEAEGRKSKFRSEKPSNETEIVISTLISSCVDTTGLKQKAIETLFTYIEFKLKEGEFKIPFNMKLGKSESSVFLIKNGYSVLTMETERNKIEPPISARTKAPHKLPLRIVSSFIKGWRGAERKATTKGFKI